MRYIRIDDRRVLKLIVRKFDVEWVHLTQGKDQWRTLVSTAINIWVILKRGITA
jgi:hypothetical protein